VWWLTTQEFFINWLGGLPVAQSLRLIFVKSGVPEVYLPWQMVFYLTAGSLAGIIVSLLTKPVLQEKLDNFYALVRAPVAPGEQVTVPCTLPTGAVVPAKRGIFPNTNFEMLVPSRTSVVGFLAAWGCVAAIVFSVYLIAGG
jgi:hypothetical protein